MDILLDFLPQQGQLAFLLLLSILIDNISLTLAQRIEDPKSIKKVQQGKIQYAGKYEIASNFNGRTKDFIKNLLRDKKCSALMLTI